MTLSHLFRYGVVLLLLRGLESISHDRLINLTQQNIHLMKKSKHRYRISEAAVGRIFMAALTEPPFSELSFLSSMYLLRGIAQYIGQGLPPSIPGDIDLMNAWDIMKARIDLAEKRSVMARKRAKELKRRREKKQPLNIIYPDPAKNELSAKCLKSTEADFDVSDEACKEILAKINPDGYYGPDYRIIYRNPYIRELMKTYEVTAPMYEAYEKAGYGRGEVILAVAEAKRMIALFERELQERGSRTVNEVFSRTLGRSSADR